MTRADIIQIIFGTNSEEIDAIKDMLERHCKKYDKCTDCEYDEDFSNPLCPTFWTAQICEEDWKHCVENFRILYETYDIAYARGYIEGDKHIRKSI